jgi:hypothetical protein
MRFLLLMVSAAVVVTAADARAQAPPGAPAGDSAHTWSAQAGYESFAMRDISRNMRPPDASPIAWQGDGPAVSGRYEITRSRSSHTVDATWRQARNFSYEAPTRSVAAVAGDAASRLEARYEYRRYFWRDLGIDGFDLGGAAQGIAARTALDRHITSSLSTTTRITGGGGAAVVVARLRRWQRVQFDASWANGAIVSSRSAEHSAAPDATASFSGGNLLSDTAVRVDLRVSRAARVAVTWRHYFENYASGHYSYSGVWQSFNVGVLYAR